jgi:hypothetical protein
MANIPYFVQQLVNKRTVAISICHGVGSPDVTSGQIAQRDLYGNGTSQAGWDRNPGLLNSLEANGVVLCQGSAEEAGMLRKAVELSSRQTNCLTTVGLYSERSHCFWSALPQCSTVSDKFVAQKISYLLKNQKVFTKLR